MKKLLVLLLALVVFLALAVGCEYLPDEVLESLGMSNDATDSTDDTNDDTDAGDDNVAEHTHSYEATVTEPTCTKQGYTTYRCECGDNYKDDYVSATGHSYIDTVVDPDCTNVGYTHRACACGASYNTNQTAALGHILNSVVVAPTEIDEGYTVYECYCGYETKGNFVQPTAVSQGLVYEISEDGTYSILVSCGTCTDSVVTVQRTYCGLPVEKIGTYAFGITECYTKVILPSTLKVIGNNAFSECFGLVEIEIPESVTTIEDHAFQSCRNLEYIHIPASVSYIGDGAFSAWTDNLKNITVDEDNQSYKSFEGNLYTKDGQVFIRYAVANESTSFTVPEGVVTIGEGAFSCANNLESITLPGSVRTIDRSALSMLSSLKSLYIPVGVQFIDDYAMYNLSSLTEITVAYDNQSYKSIDGNLYTKDGQVLVLYAIGKSATSFTVPEGVTEIGINAFEYANLEQIILPESLEKINDSAFACCWNLRSIVIPDGVTHIGTAAFYGNGMLTSVVIPESVAYIGLQAFDGCESITDVYYLGTEWRWGAIVIEGSNENLLGATIHFDGEGV